MITQQGLVTGQHNRPLQHGGELSQIARPVVIHQDAEGFGSDFPDVLAIFAAEPVQIVIDQVGDVPLVKAKRGHMK